MTSLRARSVRRAAETALLLLLVCNGGCSKEPAVTPAAAAPKVVADAGQPLVSAQSLDVSLARGTARFDSAALSSFLQRWLDSQNRGDFAAYAALYASKFMGVKRAGERTTRFERAGWLEDRARMFKKPMTVQALTPDIRAGSNSAELEFTQRFASGNFADEGQKRLLLVREAGELKIAHEELLASRESSRQSPGLDAAFDFHFVLKLERGLFVVLAPSTVESSAPVRLEQESDQDPQVWTTSRALATSQLDATQRALLGQRLRLDTGCSAAISELVVLSRVDPHFSTEQAWNGVDDGQPQGALSPAQQAEAAFELGSKWLAAKLAGCDDGSFAQRESTHPPVRAEPVEDAGLARRARAAFAKLPDVVAHQADFMREVEGAKGPWWERSLQIAIYRHPGSGQTVVSARAAWLGESCADFGAAEWAFFELRGKALVPLRTLAQAADVASVLDVNGDGRLELVVGSSGFGTDRELLSPDPSGPSERLEFSYQDCPC